MAGTLLQHPDGETSDAWLSRVHPAVTPASPRSQGVCPHAQGQSSHPESFLVRRCSEFRPEVLGLLPPPGPELLLWWATVYRAHMPSGALFPQHTQPLPCGRELQGETWMVGRMDGCLLCSQPPGHQGPWLDNSVLNMGTGDPAACCCLWDAQSGIWAPWEHLHCTLHPVDKHTGLTEHCLTQPACWPHGPPRSQPEHLLQARGKRTLDGRLCPPGGVHGFILVPWLHGAAQGSGSRRGCSRPPHLVTVLVRHDRASTRRELCQRHVPLHTPGVCSLRSGPPSTEVPYM